MVSEIGYPYLVTIWGWFGTTKVWCLAFSKEDAIGKVRASSGRSKAFMTAKEKWGDEHVTARHSIL
jgi:hypothetical protein